MSENKVGSDELERYQRFPPFGLVAQSAERRVVCGMVEGATPFGSAKLVREPVSRNGVLRLHKKQDPGGFLTKRRGEQRVA